MEPPATAEAPSAPPANQPEPLNEDQLHLRIAARLQQKQTLEQARQQYDIICKELDEMKAALKNGTPWAPPPEPPRAPRQAPSTQPVQPHVTSHVT